MQKLIFCLAFLLPCSQLIAQDTRLPDGGGSAQHIAEIKEEITPQQRAAIVQMLQQNEAQLRAEGKLSSPQQTAVTLFAWPLRQADNFNDMGFYGISNYVDENPSFPNAVMDYNCGNRSYDQSSGYNHRGTDIFTWPFSWQKMERNAVEIIAAAPGTIIGKTDGNFDQNCAFCSGPCDWNAVYVMHADGSVAWYGHMKSGTQTVKSIGQAVAQGEYLGVVGSSGNSTGPHLHFEVWASSAYTQLIDPWAGPCNILNGTTSWWASQQPYYVSTLNRIMTHGAAPNMTQCAPGDAPNEKINFTNGQTLYTGFYFRDQQPGQQANYAIYRPDNSVWTTWTQNLTANYSASWWYYYWILPNPAPSGNWRLEATYNGKKTVSWFSMNSSDVMICPNSYNPLAANISGTTFQWQVNTGAGFANISDNVQYAGTNTATLLLKNIPGTYQGYQYRCQADGVQFSNVYTLRFANQWVGYKSTDWNDAGNWSCGNVPDANTDVYIHSGVANFPKVNVNTTCRSLTSMPGANVSVEPGVTLTILK